MPTDTDIKQIFAIIYNKLQEPKYEIARQEGKVVTWNDFTKIMKELSEKFYSSQTITSIEPQKLK